MLVEFNQIMDFLSPEVIEAIIIVALGVFSVYLAFVPKSKQKKVVKVVNIIKKTLRKLAPKTKTTLDDVLLKQINRFFPNKRKKKKKTVNKQ